MIEQQGMKTALINKQPPDYNTKGLVSFKTIKKIAQLARNYSIIVQELQQVANSTPK